MTEYEDFVNPQSKKCKPDNGRMAKQEECAGSIKIQPGGMISRKIYVSQTVVGNIFLHPTEVTS